MKIIALLGRAGSGKSTIANHLVEHFGAKRYSFAAPLKLMVGEIFAFTKEQLYGTQAEKEAIDPRYDMSARDANKVVGTAARKYLGESVWLEACLHSIRKDNPKIAVIDDCRYVNEATYLSKIGHVVKLVCPSRQDTGKHPSEREVDLVPAGMIFATITSEPSPGSKDLIQKFMALGLV